MKLTEDDLNRQIAFKSEANQGRPTPTEWAIVDAIVCAIGFAVLMWVISLAAEVNQ